MIRVLFVGDVVRDPGCQFLRERLPGLKKYYGVDVTIVNGENSAPGNGITPASANFLLDSGADIVTTGNHVFRAYHIYDYLNEEHPVIRPANYPDGCPGQGVYILDRLRWRLAVVNLMGVSMMEALDNPFSTMDRLLSEIDTPLIFVDFHAEATGEKRALGYYLAGRVSALVGTHTHIPTADACILEGHTAYLTDVGMTGPIESVLGVRPAQVIEKLKYGMPGRFEAAPGPCRLDAALITLNETTGAAESIEQVLIR